MPTLHPDGYGKLPTERAGDWRSRYISGCAEITRSTCKNKLCSLCRKFRAHLKQTSIFPIGMKICLRRPLLGEIREINSAVLGHGGSEWRAAYPDMEGDGLLFTNAWLRLLDGDAFAGSAKVLWKHSTDTMVKDCSSPPHMRSHQVSVELRLPSKSFMAN